MIIRDKKNRVSTRILLFGLALVCYMITVPEISAQTYDFDEGIEVLIEGLISKKGAALRNKKIAVFGIIESKSRKKLEISSHIEDGIVDVLVNEGYTVIERRRIDDVIKKEIKKSVDLWFNETQVAQFGNLVGADIVVTGRYVRWGSSMLKVSIRAINVSNGKILAANKVKVLTDRIANLLKPKQHGKLSKPNKQDNHEAIAQNLSGSWNMIANISYEFIFEIRHDGSNIEGKMIRTNGREPIDKISGRVNSNGSVEFNRYRPGQWVQKYKGNLAKKGDKLILKGFFYHNGSGPYEWYAEK